jgi:hypothetical protein
VNSPRNGSRCYLLCDELLCLCSCHHAPCLRGCTPKHASRWCPSTSLITLVRLDALCRRSGIEGTQTCLPAAQHVGSSMARIQHPRTRPSRGPRPREANDAKTSRGATFPACILRGGDLNASLLPHEAAMT